MVYGDAMKNFNYYEEADRLISSLEGEGYDLYAATLRSAIEGGATGTEILMALRFHITEIVKRIPLKSESKIKALKFLVELSRALE